MRLTKFHWHLPSSSVRRVILIVLAAIAAGALITASVAYALYWKGRASLFDRDAAITPPEALIDNAEEDGQLITYKGETYRYNDAVVSLLFMGVDKSGIQNDASYGANGQADSLFVAALNTKTGNVKILPLSRETMTDVNLYDVNGNFLGTENRQLCLAYAYAAGAQEGCENVCRSVERLLYGMPIDGYIAIDFDGVKALNNAVGGVTVTALEDVKIYHNKTKLIIHKGQTVTLDDFTVIPYIQRRGDDVNANDRRMQRQKQFLGEFVRLATDNVKKNFTLLEKYYNTVKPYAVSDLTSSEITYLASTYLVGGQPALDYLSVTGESKTEGDNVAFYPDETSLYEAVLSTFYTKE